MHTYTCYINYKYSYIMNIVFNIKVIVGYLKAIPGLKEVN